MSLQSPTTPQPDSPILPNGKHSIAPALKTPILSVLPTTVYTDSLGKQKLREKKQKAKEITSVGTSTAFARTIIMQSLWLFYRTPIKVTKKIAYKRKLYTFFYSSSPAHYGHTDV
jgi:hypothetical protein